jgi:hypothetical protein
LRVKVSHRTHLPTNGVVRRYGRTVYKSPAAINLALLVQPKEIVHPATHFIGKSMFGGAASTY